MGTGRTYSEPSQGALLPVLPALPSARRPELPTLAVVLTSDRPVMLLLTATAARPGLGLGQSLAHSHGLSRSFHGLHSLGGSTGPPRTTGLGPSSWASVSNLGTHGDGRRPRGLCDLWALMQADAETRPSHDAVLAWLNDRDRQHADREWVCQSLRSLYTDIVA